MKTTMPLVLASQSPRRKMLLERLGLNFTVKVVPVSEERYPYEPPPRYTQRMAEGKARASLETIEGDAAVLAADTIVVLEDEFLGKPETKNDAFNMLESLSNRAHTVYTSVILIIRRRGEEIIELNTVATEVSFRKLFVEEIVEYIKTDEPFDKAGAYAIQGLAVSFIDHVSGSFTNVIGFPLKTVIEMLEKQKLIIPEE